MSKYFSDTLDYPSTLKEGIGPDPRQRGETHTKNVVEQCLLNFPIYFSFLVPVPHPTRRVHTLSTTLPGDTVPHTHFD